MAKICLPCLIKPFAKFICTWCRKDLCRDCWTSFKLGGYYYHEECRSEKLLKLNWHD